MKKENLEIILPFDGFYDSIWSEGIDSEGTSVAEHYAETERELYAPEVRLDESDIAEIIFDCMSYRKAYAAVARGYVDALAYAIDDVLGFNPGFEFGEMTSPKFYNFETDRIFAFMPRAAVAKLVRIVRRDRYATLAKLIDERHSSRSGFHSYYKNDLESWLAKPVSKWDCNELTTLLLAAVDVATANDYDRKRGRSVEDLLRWKSYDYFADHDHFCHEFEAGMDWEKFETMLIEKRTEKAAEFEADHGEVPVMVPRCEDTKDLFTNR